MKDSNQASATPIRFPADLKKWLKNEAENNHRSLTGEVIYRLEQGRAQQKAKEMQQ